MVDVTGRYTLGIMERSAYLEVKQDMIDLLQG